MKAKVFWILLIATIIYCKGFIIETKDFISAYKYDENRLFYTSHQIAVKHKNYGKGFSIGYFIYRNEKERDDDFELLIKQLKEVK